MYALIGMLFNTSNKTYHPIFYFESPFPGDGTDSVIRFKSKGHHTTGFEKLGDAILEVNSAKEKMAHLNYTPVVDIEGVMQWSGDDIPADVALKTPQEIETLLKRP